MFQTTNQNFWDTFGAIPLSYLSYEEGFVARSLNIFRSHASCPEETQGCSFATLLLMLSSTPAVSNHHFDWLKLNHVKPLHVSTFAGLQQLLPDILSCLNLFRTGTCQQEYSHGLPTNHNRI